MLHAWCMWFSDSVLPAPQLVHSSRCSECCNKHQATDREAEEWGFTCPGICGKTVQGFSSRQACQGATDSSCVLSPFALHQEEHRYGLPTSAIDAEELPDCCLLFHFFVLGTNHHQGAQQ